MIKAQRVETAGELAACFRIREIVFVTEQHVPLELERDEYDAAALHFIALDGDTPIGTGRVVLKDGGATAKIGRVAVLADKRGLGVGALLLAVMEADPALAGADRSLLEAQVHAVRFYERLGYQVVSETFLDAGIPHRRMEKRQAGR
jgi:predicted GNAT family N-acyltransferase